VSKQGWQVDECHPQGRQKFKFPNTFCNSGSSPQNDSGFATVHQKMALPRKVFWYDYSVEVAIEDGVRAGAMPNRPILSMIFCEMT